MTENKILGTVSLHNFGKYRDEWLARDMYWDKAENAVDLVKSVRNANNEDFTLLDEWLCDRVWNAELYWKRKLTDNLEKLGAFVAYLEEYKQVANVYSVYGNGAGMVVGMGESRFFLYQPETLILRYEPAKDYSGMSVGDIRALAGSNTLTTVPAVVADGLSVSQVRDAVSERTKELDQLKQQIENTKTEQSAELAELRAEVERAMAALEEKKTALMTELEQKREALQEQVEDMNNQIFLLESQIYAIRCYMGETVRFSRVREGRNAPDNEPIVLYQKLRYLDDEMGRLASVYDLTASNLPMFEKFLASSPVALDTFAPSERCVTLVRLSKTGLRFYRSEVYGNMLDSYKLYHGNTVGIIIRNGENVYIGWTDPEEVHVTEDFIMNVNPKEYRVNNDFVGQETESQRKSRVKEERKQAKRLVAELASRIFVFNILQGIVDSSNILPLPEGVCISKESEYVVFSMADRWLPDTRYGSFTDIVERCDANDVKKGDMVITVTALYPDRAMRYDAWCNDRGRGTRNRTSDCHVSDCALYPVNLMEFDEPEITTEYDYKGNRYITSGDGSTLGEDCTNRETYEVRRQHVFVSVEKQGSDPESGIKARSNFELYRDEYINLEFMCSEWLLYAITTKNLGSWHVGGECVDYNYGIPYLKKSLDYVREREKKEAAILDAKKPGYTEENKTWMVALSEWKISHNVHRLTARNAAKFLAETEKAPQ